MSESWHYAWQGKSEGPVSPVALQDLIRAGRVRADTLVWREGMANWEPASQHFSFASRATSPGAPPPMPAYAATAGAGLYEGAPARSFTEAIKVCFQKYATFRGRASRSEYWWFVLFVALGGFVGGLLESAMGSDGQALSGVFSLATFLPSLSAQVRRLHDTNRSGWWIGGFYLAFIPFVLMVGVLAGFGESISPGGGAGALLAMVFGLSMLGYVITMIIFMVSRGTPGPNRFG